MSPGSQKTFRKSMLPGSQPRFRKRHPAVREPTLPGSQGCRLFAPRQSKEPTVRCTPVPGSQGIDVTRQSRVSTVCHPAVGKPSNSGPDCGLSKHYPAFAVGGPVSATSHRCYPAFVAWKSPGARGRAGGPPPSGPRGNPPKLRACSPPPTLRLERGASVGGELRTLALKNLGDVRADAQWIVTARLLYHLHDPVAQPSRMQGIYPRAR